MNQLISLCSYTVNDSWAEQQSLVIKWLQLQLDDINIRRLWEIEPSASGWRIVGQLANSPWSLCFLWWILVLIFSLTLRTLWFHSPLAHCFYQLNTNWIRFLLANLLIALCFHLLFFQAHLRRTQISSTSLRCAPASVLCFARGQYVARILTRNVTQIIGSPWTRHFPKNG